MSDSNEPPVYTLAEGSPVQDAKTQHLRSSYADLKVVHAKAAGAWGQFECTHDITDWCSAAPFRRIGKQTKVLARLSTVAGEKGSSDTLRDMRGFALKMTHHGGMDQYLSVQFNV
ncbi:hypothetical protein ACHAPJ_012814 [Fusarium lateritium]